jgi:CIC family chloride channel protein
MLLTLLVAKTAATAITMASRFGGGVFSPALYLGAMTGGAFGIIAASVFPQMASSEGLYAIIGMGAVTAAILGAPISTTLIVFELTGGYEVTIALLLAVSMAVAVMQAIHGRSLFHWQLGLRGLFLTEGPQRQLGRQLTVRAFMTPLAEGETPEPDKAAPMLTPDDTLESALRSFNAAGRSRLAVVDAADAAQVVGWADHVRALDAFNAALIAANVEEHR